MATSFYSVYEHIVFSTKNRRDWLTPAVSPELFAYLAGTVRNHDCQPLIVGGYINHVHLLVRKKSTLTTPDLIKELKRTSSEWLSARGIASGHFHWQNGYGAFSVSYWDIDKIKAYIANQESHHAGMTWEDEFRKLLIKHGEEYDERYYLD